MQRLTEVIRSKNGEYRLGELLGQGQFGRVYKGYSEKYPEGVAIKMIRRSKFLKNEKLKHLLQRQMEVLSTFKHPNIIQFHQMIIDKQDVYLIYEYCEGGTLQERIILTEEQTLPLLQQIVEGLSQAERKGVLHRDLKPANILFKNGKIKIADWGFSRLLAHGETTCSFIGSPAYMAPQILKGDQYTTKTDVWSLGVVLFETLTGTCPWRSSSINTLYTEISRKSLKFPKDINISYRMKSMISEMLSMSPTKRPNCQKIKQKIMGHQDSRITTSNSESSVQKHKQITEDIKEHKKIAGCVFFLEFVQWCRKQVVNLTTLLMFVKLVEKNLMKLKPDNRQEQIFPVWQKELKVVKDIKKKIEKRNILNSFSSGKSYSGSNSRRVSDDDELNPEGQWQTLAKTTIKMTIELLETGYKSTKQNESRKQKLLIEINLLLDLIIFPQVPGEYLKTPFQKYLLELRSYTLKNLLKLINQKLVLINKKYYN